MFAVWTLFSSFLLIVLLFFLKHLELRGGKVFFRGFRQRADVFITDHLPHLHRNTLKAGKEISHHAAMSGLHYLTSSLLVVVRAIEQRLSHVLDMIRGRRRVTRQGNASSFLMKVSEHKKVNGNKPNRLSKNTQ